MSHGRLALILLLDLAFVAVAAGVGTVVLGWLERAAGGGHDRDVRSLLRFGASLLAGFGVLAYTGVVLGLLHVFSASAVIATLVGGAVAGRREVAGWVRAGLQGAPRAFAEARDPFSLALGLAAITLAFLGFISAAAPAIADDALSYHLPQAHELAEGHVLWLNLGGHPFYGAIPKLVEVLFAEGVAVYGDALAKVLHFSVLLGFLAFSWGTIARFFDARRATLTVLALLCYHELVANGRSALIDTAVASFEVAGLLAAASWFQERRRSDAVRAALFIGLAVGSKYTALFSLVFVAVGFGVVAIVERWHIDRLRRSALGLGAVVAAAGGFWYVKNLVKYGNPTYPFYFGHKGIPNDQYQALSDDIRQFKSRTLTGFLDTPQRFAVAGDLVPYLSFYLAPFAGLVSKARRFTLVLGVYVAAYLPYWYFVASHAVRRLMPAMCVLAILAAGTLAAGLEHVRWRRRSVFATAGAAAALGALWVSNAEPLSTAQIPGRLVFPHALRYVIGADSRDTYLAARLGCHYRVVAWLNAHRTPGNVLDTWTQWNAPDVSYYLRHRRSVAVVSPDSLVADDVRFYYVDEHTLSQWPTPGDAMESAYYRAHVGVDEAMARTSKTVYRSGSCVLKRLDGGPRQIARAAGA